MAHKGLKIVFIAICCVALVTMLVVPSFAVEGNSRAIQGFSPNMFYRWTPSTSLTELQAVYPSTHAKIEVYDYRLGVVLEYNNVQAIGFSYNAITVALDNFDTTYTYVDLPNLNSSVVRISGYGTFSGDVDTWLASWTRDPLYDERDLDTEYGEGFQNGQTSGRAEGYNDGFDDGYEQAVDDLSEGGTWASLGEFFVNIIGSFTSAELFYGFSIGTVLSMIVGAMLFWLVLKILR